MAFMDKLRRAFGFGDEIENEDSILADATPPARPRDIHGALVQSREDVRVQQSGPEAHPGSDGEVQQTATDMPMPESIFTTVVEVFNSSLPPFLNQSVDPEAQRKHIYGLLDQSAKKYINDVSEAAQESCRRQYAAERKKMLAEMEQLRQANRSVKESGEGYKQQQLSAERQKRALQERLQDLEKQVATLDAEREQFELENKSLLNKIRLMSVQEGDVEALRSENNDLRARIQQLRAGGDEAAQAEHVKEIEEITARLNEALAEVEQAKENADSQQKLIEQLNGQLEESRAAAEQLEAVSTKLTETESKLSNVVADRDQLQTVYDELKSKQEMSDVMLNDLNAKCSEAMHRMAQAERELEAATATDEQVEQLKHQMDKMQEANKLLRAEAERGTAAIQVLGEVQTQLEEFERAKNKREARITELIEAGVAKDEQIDGLQHHVRQLNSTIESMRRDFEARLRQHRYDSDDTEADGQVFDSSLDDTDWLVSTPPPGTDARTPGVPDSEFGYQEPKRRKQAPNDPAQMSLF